MTKFRIKVKQLVSRARKMGTKAVAMAVAGVMLLGAFPLPAQAFAYHDNDIRLINKVGRYEIWGGDYLIRDLGISEGQDPDHLNYVGQMVELDKEAEDVHHFRFRVGRHTTESIVEGWNKRFTVKNAVRGDCYELSFWFLGQMKLTIQDKEENLLYWTTFEDVGMAQRHSGGKDPWHFGQVGGECTKQLYLTTYGTAEELNGDTCSVKITYELLLYGKSSSSYEFNIVNIEFYN